MANGSGFLKGFFSEKESKEPFKALKVHVSVHDSFSIMNMGYLSDHFTLSLILSFSNLSVIPLTSPV